MKSAKWLKAHGYDGLYGEECGCGLDDLMPCGEKENDCKPAYYQHHKRPAPAMIDGESQMCSGGALCGCLGPRKPAPRPASEEKKCGGCANAKNNGRGIPCPLAYAVGAPSPCDRWNPAPAPKRGKG